MKFSTIKLLAICTVLIMSVSNCACDDEGCLGSHTQIVVSSDDCIVLYFNSHADYGHENVDWPSYYRNPVGANDPSAVHEFNMADGNDTLRIDTRYFDPLPQVRLPNGWSDIMSHEKAYRGIVADSEELECPETGDDDANVDYFITNVVDSIDPTYCTTPPTYLHLVMDSLRDYGRSRTWRPEYTSSEYSIKSRSWGIDSLLDDQGNDLKAHPNWACFADNWYSFINNGRVAYWQGDSLCDGETRVGHQSDQRSQFFNFSVTAQDPYNHENPGQIKLTIHAAGFVDGLEDVVFLIDESDYNRITGTIEKDGEVAHFVIIPR